MARSRLTKRQQRQMMRQTVYYAGLAIIVTVVFIFFVMPRFITLADKLFNRDAVVNSEDQVPPPTPILSAPVDATNSATLPISGFGEAGAKAVLVLNGEELDEVVINEEGDFEFDVTLEDGENSLLVYSVDENDNESVKTRSYQVILDQEAPSIEIEQPTDGQQIELRKNQVTTILGKTEPNSRVFINDRLVYPNSEGGFNMSYQLQEGENTLKFRVIDQAGNTAEKEIKVNFRL